LSNLDPVIMDDAPEPSRIIDTITSTLNVDRGTAIVALFALLVAMWSAIIARRGVKAAERSAHFAERSAGAAERSSETAAQSAGDQVRAAFTQTHQQKVLAEVDVLAAARDRIDQAAPKLLIAIDFIDGTPLVAEAAYEIPAPHPPITALETARQIDFNDWHFDVYFLARGTILNSGTDPVRVFPMDLRFVDGVHPVTGEPVKTPQKLASAKPTAIIYPGQLACFELLADGQVRDWVDMEGMDKSSLELSKTVLARPARTSEPLLTATLTFSVRPGVVRIIEPKGEDPRNGDLKVSVADSRTVTCEIEYFTRYPDSIDRLHAQMTNDEEALERHALERLNREISRETANRMRR
jgi:hypothetical protein